MDATSFQHTKYNPTPIGKRKSQNRKKESKKKEGTAQGKHKNHSGREDKKDSTVSSSNDGENVQSKGKSKKSTKTKMKENKKNNSAKSLLGNLNKHGWHAAIERQTNSPGTSNPNSARRSFASPISPRKSILRSNFNQKPLNQEEANATERPSVNKEGSSLATPRKSSLRWSLLQKSLGEERKSSVRPSLGSRYDMDSPSDHKSVDTDSQAVSFIAFSPDNVSSLQETHADESQRVNKDGYYVIQETGEPDPNLATTTSDDKQWSPKNELSSDEPMVYRQEEQHFDKESPFKDPRRKTILEGAAKLLSTRHGQGNPVFSYQGYTSELDSYSTPEARRMSTAKSIAEHVKNMTDQERLSELEALSKREEDVHNDTELPGQTLDFRELQNDQNVLSPSDDEPKTKQFKKEPEDAHTETSILPSVSNFTLSTSVTTPISTQTSASLLGDAFSTKEETSMSMKKKRSQREILAEGLDLNLLKNVPNIPIAISVREDSDISEPVISIDFQCVDNLSIKGDLNDREVTEIQHPETPSKPSKNNRTSQLLLVSSSDEQCTVTAPTITTSPSASFLSDLIEFLQILSPEENCSERVIESHTNDIILKTSESKKRKHYFKTGQDIVSNHQGCILKTNSIGNPLESASKELEENLLSKSSAQKEKAPIVLVKIPSKLNSAVGENPASYRLKDKDKNAEHSSSSLYHQPENTKISTSYADNSQTSYKDIHMRKKTVESFSNTGQHSTYDDESAPNISSPQMQVKAINGTSASISTATFHVGKNQTTKSPYIRKVHEDHFKSTNQSPVTKSPMHANLLSTDIRRAPHSWLLESVSNPQTHRASHASPEQSVDLMLTPSQYELISDNVKMRLKEELNLCHCDGVRSEQTMALAPKPSQYKQILDDIEIRLLNCLQKSLGINIEKTQNLSVDAESHHGRWNTMECERVSSSKTGCPHNEVHSQEKLEDEKGQYRTTHAQNHGSTRIEKRGHVTSEVNGEGLLKRRQESSSTFTFGSSILTPCRSERSCDGRSQLAMCPQGIPRQQEPESGVRPGLRGSLRCAMRRLVDAVRAVAGVLTWLLTPLLTVVSFVNAGDMSETFLYLLVGVGVAHLLSPMVDWMTDELIERALA